MSKVDGKIVGVKGRRASIEGFIVDGQLKPDQLAQNQ